MADNTEYSKKHPDYSESYQRRGLALDLYEGGRRVEENPAYLIRHPYETQKQYDIRFQRATYRNFAAPIVDVFASFINEGRPQRVLPAKLEDMQDNVDRLGTKANTFFADVTRLAAAGGIRFVQVDAEPQAGITQAEAEEAGRRQWPYFISLDPTDVWDWEIGADGLDWVVIHGAGMEGNAPFTKGTRYETLTVWTRTEWTRYRRETDSTAKAATSLGWKEYDKGINPSGVVPVVPFTFEDTAGSIMSGVPATDDVLSLVLRIYRRDSELDKMLFDRAVPLLNVNGLSKEDWADFVVGSSNALMSTDPGGITAQYVESTGTSFSAQTEFLTRDENSVREIALRMIRPQSGVGESAESKQIDRQQLDTQLANFARRCANAEAQCWKIAARWMRLDDGDISTPYTENYDVEAAGDAIVSALVSLNSQAIISKQTIRDTSAVKKMMPEGWKPEEEETRLQQELGSTRGASGTLRLPNILGGTGTQGMNI